MCKGKTSAQINPCNIVDYYADIFLAQLSRAKSLRYCVHNFCILGEIGYACWVQFVEI